MIKIKWQGAEYEVPEEDLYLFPDYESLEKDKPGKTTPTGQGAPVEETAAPVMVSSLDPGLSVSQERAAKKAAVTIGLSGAGIDVPSGISGGVAGLASFLTRGIPNIIDFGERASAITGPGLRSTLAKFLYNTATNTSNKSTIEILEETVKKSGEGIDFSPIYEIADELDSYKDALIGQYDSEGNRLDLFDLINQGRIADAANYAVGEALSSAPSLAISYAFPVFGSAALGVMTAGQELEKELKEDPEKGLANIYLGSTLKGIAEFGTEFLGARFFRGVQGLGARNAGEQAIKDFVKTGFKKYVDILGSSTLKGIIGFSTEAATEGATSVLQDLTDVLVYNDPLEFNRIIRNAGEQAIIGGLLGGPVSSAADFSNRVQNSNNKKLIYNYLAPKQQQQKLNQLRYKIGDLELRKEKYIQQGRKDKVQELIDLRKEELKNAENNLFERFDFLTKPEIKQYYENHQIIKNNLYDVRNNKFTEAEKKDISEEITNKTKENERILGKDIYNAEIEKELTEALNDIEIVANRFGKLKGVNKEDLDIVFTNKNNRPKDMGNAAGLFLDESGSKPTIYIDAKNVAETESTNVLGHELLHYVFSRAFKTNNKSMAPLVDSFKEYLKRTDEGNSILNRIEERINNKYKNPDGTIKDGALEEYFTIFSDIISKERISLDETKLDKIKRNLKNTIDNLIGKSNVKIDTGKDIVNFIRNFNNNVNRKNKLLNYTLTTTKEGVELQDKTETLKKKSVDESSISQALDKYITEDIQTQEDFKKNNEAISGIYTEIEINNVLDGYITNMIIEDKNLGGLPSQIQEDAKRKIKERITDRIIKNFDPNKEGNKRSLFSYVYGKKDSRGRGGIAYKSLLDIKSEYVKQPQTTQIEKQTKEGVSTIPVQDTGMSIEDLVDLSLLQTEQSIPKSKLKRNTSIVDDALENEIFEIASAAILSGEIGVDDKAFRNFYTKIFGDMLYKSVKAKMKNFDKFLDDEYSAIINDMPIQFFIQAEKLSEEKIFTKFVKRLTNQSEIRKARDEGRAFVENEAQGVSLYNKLKPPKDKFKEFFNVRGRKDALARGIAVQLGFDMMPSVFDIAEFNQNEKATAARKLERIVGAKFSKETRKKNLENLFNSPIWYQTISQFSRNYNNYNDAINGFIEKAEVLSKEFPEFDPIQFMKNKTGQSAELFLAQKMEEVIPGLKILNIKDLSTLKTGDTGVDIEAEYKGTKFGIEVKTKVTDRTGSFVQINSEILPKGFIPTLENFSLEIKNDIIEDLKRIGFKESEIEISDTTIKFPKIINNEKVIKGKGDSLFKVTRSKSLIIPDKGNVVRMFYLKKGESKNMPIGYMYFFDNGLISLNNDPGKFNVNDISDLGMDSQANVVWKSTGKSSDTKVTLTRTIELGLSGKPKAKGIKYKNLNSKLSIDSRKKNLNKEFNDILEKKTGIKSIAGFSDVKGRRRGRKAKGTMSFFVPYGAEDFQGLMYALLPKGKEGDAAMEWMRQTFFRPYSVAMENIDRERAAVMNDFVALKKKLKNVPKILNKDIDDKGDFTNQDAVRVWIWSQQNMDIPGLTETDRKKLINVVNNNSDLKQFALDLILINKNEGYIKPDNNWDVGTITTDLLQNINTVKRDKYLKDWKENIDTIFDESVYNKLSAAYGQKYVNSLKNILNRMATGRNRTGGGNSQIDNWLDWLNNSVGAIMFLNVRSAVLQTISTVNYLNWNDNNPLKAAKAFANQKQYWSDFAFIFNSDYLKQRRGGTKLNIQENEIAEMANKGGVKGAISYLLNKGFVLTRSADSFAIASGGAAFYRNRLNTYLKEGLSEKEAQKKAFSDFREITEESQQSSRPDRISKEQASGLGRVFLAFANTPMQYTRLMKRAAQDLIAGRGDAKTNMSKLIYYGVIQNFIFNALQQALFALGFDEEEEEEKIKEKYTTTINGMLDSILRGTGVAGNAVMVGKNFAIDIAKRAQKPRPNFADAAWKLLDISPPFDSKVTKIRSALYTLDYSGDAILDKGLSLENPAAMASAQTISAFTNVPLDRVMRLYDNIRGAVAEDTEAWQRVALLLGWSSWELGIDKEKNQPKIKIRRRRKSSTTKRSTTKR